MAFRTILKNLDNGYLLKTLSVAKSPVSIGSWSSNFGWVDLSLILKKRKDGNFEREHFEKKTRRFSLG